MLKTRLALVPLAALALTLSACGSQATPSATPSVEPSTPTSAATAGASPTAEASPSATPSATPTPIPVSNNLDAVSVSGEPGAAPQVAIASPWAIDSTRRQVLKEGQGPEATDQSIVDVHYVGVNGRTGRTFDSSWEGGRSAQFSLQQVVPGFTKGLTGARAGERVVIGMPGSDGYDSSGGSPTSGIEVGDSLVFVVDVLAVSVETATGQPTGEQAPVGVGDDAGKPTVTIPQGQAQPTTDQATTVIRGEQRGVGENDTVVVKYRAFSWRTGQLVEDKFDQPQAGSMRSVLDSWKAGLVGAPIGSRVVIVAANPYPQGNENPKIEAGDSVVYVVDVLFSAAAQAS